MFKKMLTASVTAFSLFVIGCGTTDPEDATAPTITGPVKIDTLKAGTPVNAIIEITAKDTVTFSGRITTAAGVVSTAITATPALTKNDIKEKKVTYTLTSSATTPAGAYYLEISATSAGLTSTVKFDLVVPGAAGTPVTTAEIIAGANKHATAGSSIDLDAGVAYLSAAAATNLASIDLCYAHTASAGDKLGTPTWAKLSGYDFAVNWANPPTTMKFYKTALTAAQFDAITTKEAIPAFVDANATAESAVTVAGDVFIVKTTAGAICLLKIASQVAGETGTITIKTAK